MGLEEKKEKRTGTGSIPALIRENISCNIAVLWLGLVVMLFNYPVNLALRLSDLSAQSETVATSISVESYSGSMNGPTSVFVAGKTDSLAAAFTSSANQVLDGSKTLLSIIIIVAAALCAVSMFRYLFSRKAVDFYHSQPVTRSKRFAANFLSGSLIMLICMAAGFVGALLVAAFYRVDDLLISQALLFQLGYFLNFLLCYALCITAVLLTGSLWSAVGAGFCLFVAGPALEAIAASLCNTYFHTWVYTNEAPLERLFYLSPVVVLTRFAELLQAVRVGLYPGSALMPYFVGAGLGAVFLSILNLLLMQKRPSESAGRPLAFRSLARPVRIVLSCYGGLTLSFMGESYSFLWALFFLIAGTALFHAMLEGILQMDVRAVFQNRVELLLCVAASALLFCGFVFDVAGYDRFLPATDQIAEIGVNVEDQYDVQYAIPRAEYAAEHQVEQGSTYPNYYMQDYWEKQPSVLTGMHLTQADDIEAVRGLVQAAQNADVSRLSNRHASGSGTYMQVRYRLKNGRETRRSYEVPEEAMQQYMPTLYESAAYKEGLFPILQLKPEQLGTFALLYREEDGKTEAARLAKGEAALETMEQNAQMEQSAGIESASTESASAGTAFVENTLEAVIEVTTDYDTERALDLSGNRQLQEKLLWALQQDLRELRYEDLPPDMSMNMDALYYIPRESVEAEQRAAAQNTYYDRYGWYHFEDRYPILESFTNVRTVLQTYGLMDE